LHKRKNFYLPINLPLVKFIPSTHRCTAIIKTFRRPGDKGSNRGHEMESIDLGNNESLKTGVFPAGNGTWLAMTFTRSKTFKTEAGARRWYSRNSND